MCSVKIVSKVSEVEIGDSNESLLPLCRSARLLFKWRTVHYIPCNPFARNNWIRRPFGPMLFPNLSWFPFFRFQLGQLVLHPLWDARIALKWCNICLSTVLSPIVEHCPNIRNHIWTKHHKYRRNNRQLCRPIWKLKFEVKVWRIRRNDWNFAPVS